jgi:spore coat polysaccharide biosynthesis predicted glycosyltransferase SpsG/GNAT superfamily N-acetyltransferase
MRVLLRCDGGGPLGVGHVIRSLALAEAAVAAGHDVLVAGKFEGSFLAGQLSSAPVKVVPLGGRLPGDGPRSLTDLVERVRPDVVHVDSYEAVFGEAPMRDEVFGDVVLSNVEDGTFGRRPADVVVDPTLGSELSPRPDDGSTWLLRGSRYMPVRRRVMDARRGDAAGILAEADTANDPVARSVLVVMGGTDPAGLAPAAVRLLAGTGLDLEVTAVAVGENAERVRAAAASSRLTLKVLAPVDDLPEMMSGQDLVISAAGTSVWELCCIGVPMAVIWAVDNQRAGYQRVVAAGAAVGLGGPELGRPEAGGPEVGADEGAVSALRGALTDSRVRAGLVLAGRNLVDGLGAWRVVRTWEQAGRQLQTSPRGLRSSPGGLRSSPGGLRSSPGAVPSTADDQLVARPATPEDSRALWQWRNDAGTRAGSRSASEVPWLEHTQWLRSSLARDDRVLLVVEDHLGSVGTVRWDVESEGEWQVSVTVAPGRRGQSLARPLLRAGEVSLSEMARSRGVGVTAYLAVVHRDNHASLRLFETSCYVPDLPPNPRGFMRFRKAAPVLDVASRDVASLDVATPWENA